MEQKRGSMKVTYRAIARSLVMSLPTGSDDEFISKVDEYTEAIERLPIQSQVALKAAYIFAAKSIGGIDTPSEEQQDCFQDYFTAVLEKQTDIEPLAYTIARRQWIDKLKKHSRRIATNSQELETSSATACDTEFITRIESAIDADRIWQVLPSRVKNVVLKRLNKQPLTGVERLRLHRYIKHNGGKIRELITA